MKTIPVQSSNIAGIGYDPDRRELRVEFKADKGGTVRVHDHVDVPPEVHSQLMAADSPGKFYRANIKDKFQSRRMPDRPHDPMKDVGVYAEHPIDTVFRKEAEIPPPLADAIKRYQGQK